MAWLCMPRHRQEPHVPHAGAIQDVLKAASQIEKLEFLDLQGQAFSGTLPTQYNFPNLMELNLINNNVGVGLQTFNFTRAPCKRAKGHSAGAAPSMCMRYAGLCMHAHQALQLLVCTEPLTAAFPLRLALLLWRLAACTVGTYETKHIQAPGAKPQCMLWYAGDPPSRVGPEWHVSQSHNLVSVLQSATQRGAASSLGIGQQLFQVPAAL